MKKQTISLIIITFLIGCLIGNAIGVMLTIKTIAYIGMGFIDEDLVQAAIYKYRNNINYCYPPVLLGENET